MGCSAACSTVSLGDDIMPPLLVTFGISVVIQNLLLQTVFGGHARTAGGRSGHGEPAAWRRHPVGWLPLLTLVGGIA